MKILNNLKLFIIALFSIFATLYTVFKSGQSSGKNKLENKINKKKLKDNENIYKERRSTSNLSNDDLDKLC
jgi:hypothetical protein